MRRLLVLLALSVPGLLGVRAGTSELYENIGNVSGTPPQIDARVFVNYGNFTAVFNSFATPFETWNTRSYTNTGLMQGLPGFRLDHFDSLSGQHKRAAVVANLPGAEIYSTDVLMINAENVYNQGTISGATTTYIGLQGGKVDFSRGLLNIAPASSDNLDPGSESSTNFFPATGMYDYYWGGFTNDVAFNSTNLILLTGVTNRFDAVSPPHSVSNEFSFGTTRVFLSGAQIAIRSNAFDTNFIIQVALVQVPTNMSASILFAPSSISTNLYNSVAFQLTSLATNSVTGQQYANTVYFADRLASDTNNVLLTNVLTGLTYRPGCYSLSYAPGREWALGRPGNGRFSTNLFYATNFVSPIITNSLYAGYSADILTSVGGAGAVPGADITNSAGRVEINADSLDMSNARMRGNSIITVSTRHLVGSLNTSVDAPYVSYALGSTNGQLQVTSLVREEVPAFDGTIYAWSGAWTNFATAVSTNGTGTNATVVTNTLNYAYSVTMLEASSFVLSQPVYVQDFATASTNTVINDSMNVTRTFRIEGQSLDLRSRVALQSGSGWGRTNAPLLKYYTNHGILSVSGNANFGGDRLPYERVENYGTNTATALTFRSRYLRNSGVLRANQLLRIEADVAKLQDGLSQSLASDIVLGGYDVKLHAYTNQTPGRISINVTNTLSDSGGGAGVAFQPGSGFDLVRKPRSGDLLGSSFQAIASPNSVVYNRWVAEDRDATVAGFLDNVAVGRLFLGSGANGVVILRGSGSAKNAMYVDSLTLSGFVLQAFEDGRLGDVLSLGENFTLYFAVANVPAEQLDGQLGGHIRWVKDFAGPNSSIQVIGAGGKLLTVNRALRESPTIDSDMDGIANAYDQTPFGGPSLTAQAGATPSDPTRISWMAASGGVYHVEYATDLAAPDWQELKTVTNDAPSMQLIVVEDSTKAASAHRYYRVRLGP